MVSEPALRPDVPRSTSLASIDPLQEPLTATFWDPTEDGDTENEHEETALETRQNQL